MVLALARVKHELAVDLRAAGLLDAVGTERVFLTLPTAVAAFDRRAGQVPALLAASHDTGRAPGSA